MKVKPITKELLEPLMPRMWGSVNRPSEELPQWLADLASEAQQELLASGPNFEPAQGRTKLISSPAIFDQTAVSEEELPVELDDGWVVLVYDPRNGDAVLLQAPFDRHQEWLKRISRMHSEVSVYCVPKNPEQ